MSDSSMRPTDDIAECEAPCGGSGDALKVSLGITVVLGLVIVKLWPDR